MATGGRVDRSKDHWSIGYHRGEYFVRLVALVSMMVLACCSRGALGTGKDIYVRSATGALFKLHNPSDEVRGYTCTGCGDATLLEFPKDSEHIAMGMKRFPCSRCKTQLCPECDWATDICPSKGCGAERQGETGSSHAMDVDGTIQGRIKDSDVTCTAPNCVNFTLPIKLRDIDSHTSHPLKLPASKEAAEGVAGASEEMMEVAIAASGAGMGKTSFAFAGTRNCPTCEKFRVANEYSGDRSSAEYRSHRNNECAINRRVCRTCNQLVLKKDAKEHSFECLNGVLEKQGSTVLSGDVLDKVVRQMVPLLSEQRKLLASETDKNRELTALVQQQAQTLGQLQHLYDQLCTEHRALDGRCSQLEVVLRQHMPASQSFMPLPIEPVAQELVTLDKPFKSQDESLISAQLVNEALASGSSSLDSLPEIYSAISSRYDSAAEKALMLATEQQRPAYLSTADQCSIAFGNQDSVRLMADVVVTDGSRHISDYIYTREIRGQERSSELAFIVQLPTVIGALNSTIHLPEFTLFEAVEGSTEMHASHLRVVIKKEEGGLTASVRYLADERPLMRATEVFEWIGFIHRDSHIISAYDFLPTPEPVTAGSQADNSQADGAQSSPPILDSLGYNTEPYAVAAWPLKSFEESVQPIRVNSDDANQTFVFLVLGVKPERIVMRQGREQVNNGYLVDNTLEPRVDETSPTAPKRRKVSLGTLPVSE